MATALQHHPLSTGFGNLLRGARERRGLTLREVSNETKIPWRHLDAIEHGDLSVVPNRIYRRAEVRAYAQAVGLDQNVALAELDQAISASGLDVDSAPRTIGMDEATRRRSMVATLATVGVAAMLLLALQLWLRKPAETQSSDSSVAAPSVPDTTPASPDVEPAATTRTPVGSAVDRDTSRSVAPSPVVTPSAATTAAVAPVEDAAAPATAPAPGAVAPSDALVVTTEPAGARVVVDGIGWGTTPLRIRFLTPGDKTVRVIKDGYASEERTVHIADGRSSSLHVPLRSGAN